MVYMHSLRSDELESGYFVCFILQNKTIKAYSPDVISELNQKNPSRQGLDLNTVYSMPFGPFNEASIKNKVSWETVDTTGLVC